MAVKKKTGRVDAPAQVGKEERKRALESALKQIEKDFGKGAVMRLGENLHMNVESIPTGSLALDAALGIGGLPKGRIVEIYGPEASGKTTLALHVVAEAQKKGGEAAFIDVEHALDPVYAAALGVDIDALLISQPDTGEQALEIAEALIRSGAVDVVVVDSVAALVPRAEIEGEMGEAQVGAQARLMSQAMRKLAGAVAKTNCMAVFINQLRLKIGVIYGSPEVTAGGNALKYYASVRLDVRRAERLKDGNDHIGATTRVRVVKNKVAPPFKEVTFDIMYGEGISLEGELIDLGVQLGIVDKAGAWFSYKETRLGQGRDNAKTFLRENEDVKNEISQLIRDNFDKLNPPRETRGKAKTASAADEDADVDDEEKALPSAASEKVTKSSAKAKIDIAVDDDDE